MVSGSAITFYNFIFSLAWATCGGASPTEKKNLIEFRNISSDVELLTRTHPRSHVKNDYYRALNTPLNVYIITRRTVPS